jgi:hypothetical protein
VWSSASSCGPNLGHKNGQRPEHNWLLVFLANNHSCVWSSASSCGPNLGHKNGQRPEHNWLLVFLANNHSCVWSSSYDSQTIPNSNHWGSKTVSCFIAETCLKRQLLPLSYERATIPNPNHCPFYAF